MMSRYYPPPQISGRPINFAKLGRGKRHYWGQKGKSYGFYTSGQQIDMEGVRHKHRRIKSQMNNSEYETNPQMLNRRATQILHQTTKKKEQASQFKHRIYTQTGVQSEQTAAQGRQMATSPSFAHVNVRQRLQEYVDNHKEENKYQEIQNQQFLQNRSFLPKINEKRNTNPLNNEFLQKTSQQITMEAEFNKIL